MSSYTTVLDCRVGWLGLATCSYTHSPVLLICRSYSSTMEMIQDVNRPQQHLYVSPRVTCLIFQQDSCILRLTLYSHRILNFSGVLGELKPQWSDWHKDEIFGGGDLGGDDNNTCILVLLHWVKCSLPTGHSDMLSATLRGAVHGYLGLSVWYRLMVLVHCRPRERISNLQTGALLHWGSC